MRIWMQLGLCRATLAQIEARLRDGGGEERQPAPRKFVLTARQSAWEDERAAPATVLNVWRGQEPAERIGNTILLCAIRDHARQVIMEPKARELRVQFLLPQGVREQKLPSFALKPILDHFQSLAQNAAQHENESFSVELRVDEHRYRVQFSALSTQWGEGMTMQFSLAD